MKNRAFTLLELLVVMGIIALMIGIAVPSFNSMNKGANIRTATSQVLASMAVARQYSVASRQKVIFCIPKTIVAANSYVRTNMLFSSYVMWTEETKGVLQSSTIIGKVETLPKGVVFKDDPATFVGIWKDLPFATNGVNLFTGYCVRFAPTGSIHWQDLGTPTYNLILTEGTIDASGKPQYFPGAIVVTNELRSATGRCVVKN